MRSCNGKRGFTIIEIMVTVMVIGVLVAVVFQVLIKGRQTAQKNACISNLKQIQGAIQVWANDTGAPANATFTTADICDSYLKVWPREGAASYPVPSSVIDTPVCPNSASNSDHRL